MYKLYILVMTGGTTLRHAAASLQPRDGAMQLASACRICTRLHRSRCSLHPHTTACVSFSCSLHPHTMACIRTLQLAYAHYGLHPRTTACVSFRCSLRPHTTTCVRTLQLATAFATVLCRLQLRFKRRCTTAVSPIISSVLIFL